MIAMHKDQNLMTRKYPYVIVTHYMDPRASTKARKYFFLLRNPICWAFILSFLYWTYLAATTTMEVKYDGRAYQQLGTTLHNSSIEGFFKAGGSNVILYPLIIAFSMHIADFLNISHFPVQTWVQIFLFLTTQVLLYKILQKLRIGTTITTATLLYFGFSPALVNAAFSTWSEIASFPIVLGIVLVSIRSWKTVHGRRYTKLFLDAGLLTFLFYLVTLVREVYEYVFILFVFFYFCLSLGFLFKKQIRHFVNSVILLAASSLLFQAALTPYKLMNLEYNGYESLVLKGGVSLAGGTIARTQKLTPRQYMSFLASIPGENVIRKSFGDKDYLFWFYDQYAYGVHLQDQLRAKGVSPKDMDNVLYAESLRHILRNPLQYSLLTAGEGMKMLFWESTRIGFVAYPSWLSRIFLFTPFKNSLRLALFLMTSFALMFTLIHLWQNKSKVYLESSVVNQHIPTLFFMVFIIAANIILHAPFIVETRYSLPIAPLYLTLIAFSLQEILPGTSQNPIDKSKT